MVWLRDDGKLVVKDFGPLFPEALRIYDKARDAGKRGVTLRCKNVGWPLPEKYDNEEKMMRANRKGIWWCPYCGKMRRFVKRTKSQVDGIVFDDPKMCCPVCEASHRIVGQYNPLARLIEGRIRDPNRKRKRRRRTAEDDDE